MFSILRNRIIDPDRAIVNEPYEQQLLSSFVSKQHDESLEENCIIINSNIHYRESIAVSNRL